MEVNTRMKSFLHRLQDKNKSYAFSSAQTHEPDPNEPMGNVGLSSRSELNKRRPLSSKDPNERLLHSGEEEKVRPDSIEGSNDPNALSFRISGRKESLVKSGMEAIHEDSNSESPIEKEEDGDISVNDTLYDKFGGDDSLTILVELWLGSSNEMKANMQSIPKVNNKVILLN